MSVKNCVVFSFHYNLQWLLMNWVCFFINCDESDFCLVYNHFAAFFYFCSDLLHFLRLEKLTQFWNKQDGTMEKQYKKRFLWYDWLKHSSWWRQFWSKQKNFDFCIKVQRKRILTLVEFGCYQSFYCFFSVFVNTLHG